MLYRSLPRFLAKGSEKNGVGPHLRRNRSPRSRWNRLRLESLENRDLLSGVTHLAVAPSPPVFETTTVLSSSANPAGLGQPVTFLADVTLNSSTAAGNSQKSPVLGFHTGTVDFFDGTTGLKQARVVWSAGKGVARFTTDSLALGTHTITANFEGTTLAAPSDSAPLAESILAASETTLTSSQSPAPYGQSLTFTATVAALSSTSGTPSGSVDFRDGANDLGSVALSVVSGTAQAQLTVPNTTFSQDSNALSAGFHTITALYSGNDTFAHSTGKLSQVVTAGTTTALALAASSVNPSDFGQAVSFVATVATIAPASGTVTGVVDFTVDGGSPVSVPLHKGQATFTTRGLAVGTHTITAAYAGNAAFSASSAASPLQQVVLTATHTALTASVNPVVTSNTVTYTATVGAITVSPPGGQAVQGKAASTTVPTGTIDFYQDGTQMASVAVDASGTAQWSTSYSAAGSHKIKAVYEGDANFGSSTSAVLTERVADTNVATQVQLSASPNPAVAGAPLTFRAYVSAVSPSATGGGSTTSAGSRASRSPSAIPILPPAVGATGTVTFYVGSTSTTPLGTATLGPNDTATFTTSTLSPGTYALIAVYSGDDNFAGSTSAAYTATVVVPTPGSVTGSGTLSNKRDQYQINVAAQNTTPYYSGTLSYSDTVAGDSFFVDPTKYAGTGITSVSFGWNGVMPLATGSTGVGANQKASVIPIGDDTRATITGTAVLNPDSSGSGTLYNFVLYATNWNVPLAARPNVIGPANISIQFTDPTTGQVFYAGGGILDSGSTLSITATATPVTGTTPTAASNASATAVHQALFAGWNQDSSSPSKHGGLLDSSLT